MGLGLRSGQVVMGVDQVRAGLRTDRFACIVVAADASPRARDKVVRLAAGRGIPLVGGPAAETIGSRLGRPAVMVVGVLDRALARGLVDAGSGSAHMEA
ncbi:MAG TPA: ribosomal L7Ae/L30e/S12e/Gadd45 family protein [Gemmatimonadales bacterium]|nr:ribosomal L7Ae/L30e/S12e/Gadd45 family protein [Gemmatimonadales bacterium]